MTVKDYLESERQWLHSARVARAKSEMAKAGSDKEFWLAVLEALRK